MAFTRAKETIVEDLVSGIIGIFDRKEPAPNKEFRLLIYYKPPTPFGFLSKSRRLPSSIPKDGLIEIPASMCDDGHSRMVIFSYGDDTIHPPVISGAIKQKVGDIIKNMELMRLEMEQKSESLITEKRLFERNKDEEIKKAVERKELPNKTKRSRGLFPNIGEDEF